MQTPLIPSRSSSLPFSPFSILPSLVFLFLIVLIVTDFTDSKWIETPVATKKNKVVPIQTQTQENQPSSNSGGKAKQTAKVSPGKMSCAKFETAEGANFKCHDYIVGNIFTGRKRGALSPNIFCAGTKCVGKDHKTCCVKPVRCQQYQETSKSPCPQDKEENVDHKAFCTQNPCNKDVDEAICCVPTGSNFRVYSRGEWGHALRVYVSKDATGPWFQSYKPGRLVNVLEQIPDPSQDPKIKGRIWAKVEAVSIMGNTAREGYVVLKDNASKEPNLRRVNLEQIELPDCTATADYPRFQNAQKGETFEITCPQHCDEQIVQYTWTAQNTLYARETPEDEKKIEGWVWQKGKQKKFSIVRLHADRIWGKELTEDNSDSAPSEGWFKLRMVKPPFETFAKLNAQDVIGCGSTFIGKADLLKRSSPICIASRTRYQFGGPMEITFATEPNSYSACSKGGVQTQAGQPLKPKALAYRIGLADQEKFRKSSTLLGEMLTRKFSRFKQPGKIILKIALKAAFGIALAVLVGMASSALVVATGGVGAIPLIIGIAFAIPQGFANHAIGLAIDTTIDRWWETTDIKENPKRTSWWTAFKTKCKNQGWSGWLLGGVKGMLWPILGQASVINDAVTAGWGDGMLKITAGEYSGSVISWITDTFGHAETGAIQMSIAFSGWVMNTMLALFNQASERGRSRLDVFAMVMGLAVNLAERKGEVALGFAEEAVGIEDENIDEILAACQFDINDPEKNCLMEHLNFENGVPSIPIAFMGKIANNLKADWKVCDKTIVKDDGSEEKQWYYCLAGDDYEKSAMYIDGVSDPRISAELDESSQQETETQPQVPKKNKL